MTLEEAIRHCEEVAERYAKTEDCAECAAEHRQLAEWLKELKEYRRKGFKSYGYAEYDADYPHR